MEGEERGYIKEFTTEAQKTQRQAGLGQTRGQDKQDSRRMYRMDQELKQLGFSPRGFVAQRLFSVLSVVFPGDPSFRVEVRFPDAAAPDTASPTVIRAIPARAAGLGVSRR